MNVRRNVMAVETSQGTLAAAKPLERIQSMVLPMLKQPPPPAQPAMGFFTDTSLCIGCKACEVACKQWNELPAKDPVWTGSSYDNTGELSAITWRHVQFIEEIGRRRPSSATPPSLPLFEDSIAEAKNNGSIPQTPPGTALPFFNTERWLMRSDVCKHCANAPCQEACPTGAIIRTEFDIVYVQQDICNCCGYCVVAYSFCLSSTDEYIDLRLH